MGMSVDVAVLFLMITLALYIGVTRIVAETGLVFLDLPVNSNEMTVGVIGSTNLSPSNLTALGLTHAVSHNHRGIGLSSLIHGLKVSEGYPVKEGPVRRGGRGTGADLHRHKRLYDLGRGIRDGRP